MELDGLAQAGGRFVKFLLLGQGDAQVVVRADSGRKWTAARRLCHGLAELAQFGQGDAQAEGGLAVAGLDLEGLAEVAGGLFALALIGQGGGQAEVGLGGGRV